MKLVGRIAVVAAALVLLTVAAVAFVLWRSIPPLGGRAELNGLGAEVSVRFDAHGVPHISAGSEADAFRALGWLHARDRLWAMEIMRRAAEGRLSEVLGPAAVDADRFLRSLDIPRSAARGLTLAPAATRALAEAYVAGINGYLASPGRPLPPEFQVLRFRPEPWTVRQSLEIGRLMSWDLVNASTELRVARAVALVGPERVQDLLPVYPADGPDILPPGTGQWDGARAPRPARVARGSWREPSATLAAGEIPVVPPLAEAVLEFSSMRRASNSWVVGGGRTASGRPILANDPHLGLRAPALWYLAALETPTMTAAGGTIPGMPLVVIGRNRRIAWGLTNIQADDVDYVIERLRADSSQVLTAAGWAPVEAVRDSIRVRGRAAVPYTLRRTGHGPIVEAAPPGAGGRAEQGEVRVLAMRWNAQEPSDEMTGWLAVMRARDWTSFLDGVRLVRSPEQNWVYADVDGHIGYSASGAIPVRRSGNGLLPTPGWTDEGAWERFLDFAELPRALDPPEGFIVTANNRVVGPRYPWLISASWEDPYRAARIREMIRAGSGLTPRDVQRMQLDTLDVFAREMKGLAARAADAAGRADVAGLLRAWDGTAGADRPEPALFYAWYRALTRLTFDDELHGVYRPSSVLHAAMRSGAGPWFDDITTPEREDLPALAARAMREGLPLVEGRTWGQVHRTASPHTLGSARPLEALLRLNVGPFPRAGSPYTVNVADFSGSRPPYTNTHAASMRQVADLADSTGAALVITTGQSGNPLSRRYRDQARLWLRGELLPVPLGAPPNAAAVLRLVPARR